jgi:hypothetical protein
MALSAVVLSATAISTEALSAEAVSAKTEMPPSGARWEVSHLRLRWQTEQRVCGAENIGTENNEAETAQMTRR